VSGRRGRRVPALIALMLVASGVVRLGDGGAEAIAREVGSLATAAGGTPGSCAPPPQTAPILSRLEEREQEISAARDRLAERERTLAVAREEIETQIARLETAEKALRSTVSLAEGASETDIAQLTAVYENMEPERAAGLFASMAPEFAAGFLARMRPAAAAGIMAGLEPEKAYAISAILAGRNADVPTE